MQYFTHESLSDRLIRITEYTGVCCYLAVGTQYACLLDTCSGLGNLRSYAETLTEKPVFAVLTHGHLDHMGSAALFETVYMNPKDAPVLAKHGNIRFRVEDTNQMLHKVPSLTAADFVPTLRTVPQALADGDTFDLGGLTIQIVAVPGHTPGMVCPLLLEERSIIFGDACGVSVLLFDEFSSCVSDYRQSLMNLKQYELQYDQIYRNHGSFWSPKELLDNVIECCDLILSGQDDHIPVRIHGYDLFAAKEISADGSRADGKEGNIFYAPEKAILL